MTATGLRRSLKKWGALTLLNAPASLFFSPGVDLGRITGRPFLDFHSWPQAFAGIAAIAAALACLDALLIRRGLRSLSRALTYGAMVKAFLQIVPILDALAGVASIRAVAALPGKGGDIAIFLAALLCGFIAVGMAFGIGLALIGLDSMFSKYRDARYAQWRRDGGFD